MCLKVYLCIAHVCTAPCPYDWLNTDMEEPLFHVTSLQGFLMFNEMNHIVFELQHFSFEPTGYPVLIQWST